MRLSHACEGRREEVGQRDAHAFRLCILEEIAEVSAGISNFLRHKKKNTNNYVYIFFYLKNMFDDEFYID